MPFPLLLELAIDGLTTTGLSDNFMKDLGESPNWGPYDMASIDGGFAYLLLEIRKGTSERRSAAALLLRRFAPLAEKQRRAIQVLLNDPNTKSLAPFLSPVVEETERFWYNLSTKNDSNILKPEGVCPSMHATQIVRALRERLRPVPSVDLIRVRSLISSLDDDSFRRREKASRTLLTMGLEMETVLHNELLAQSPEARRRIEILLIQFQKERDLTLTGISILKHVFTSDSLFLLSKLTTGSPFTQVTQEAIEAYASLETLLEK